MPDRETTEEMLQAIIDMDSFELDIDADFPSSWLDYSDEGWSVVFDEHSPEFLHKILGEPTGTFNPTDDDELTRQNDNNDDGDFQESSEMMSIDPPTKVKCRRVRKNYDPPVGKREYYELTDRDVGKNHESL